MQTKIDDEFIEKHNDYYSTHSGLWSVAVQIPPVSPVVIHIEALRASSN